MSNFEVKGNLKKVLPVQTGEKKDGSGQWKKVEFVVTNNDGYEGREKTFCFQIFGGEKVDNFLKFNPVGSDVVVKFDIQTNEYNGRYYTNLSAFDVRGEVPNNHGAPELDVPVPHGQPMEETEDDLPF